MKIITFWILMLACFVISKAQDDKLIGNWEFSSNDQISRLQIVSQNELIFNNESTSYTIVNNAIRVLDEYGYYFDYQYVLQDNQLLLTFPDGYQYPFQKVEGNGQTNRLPTNTTSSTQSLYGNLCSFSSSSGGGSSYSSTKRFYFDGNGRFSFSTGASYSGSGGGYYNNDPNAVTGRYVVEGNTITMYLDDGSTQTLVVNMVQNSGEITEVSQGETYFGKNLCE